MVFENKNNGEIVGDYYQLNFGWISNYDNKRIYELFYNK